MPTALQSVREESTMEAMNPGLYSIMRLRPLMKAIAVCTSAFSCTTKFGWSPECRTMRYTASLAARSLTCVPCARSVAPHPRLSANRSSDRKAVMDGVKLRLPEERTTLLSFAVHEPLPQLQVRHQDLLWPWFLRQARRDPRAAAFSQ